MSAVERVVWTLAVLAITRGVYLLLVQFGTAEWAAHAIGLLLTAKWMLMIWLPLPPPEPAQYPPLAKRAETREDG